jgi:DNA-binding transcriptional regulator LsrR (DeoR family)
MRTGLRQQRCTMRHSWQVARQQWSRRYGPGTAGRSQRAIARDLGIDRRKIKRIIDHPT